MTVANLTHPRFMPELNTKLTQIAQAIQLLSDLGIINITGVSGLATGIRTFLVTPTSANLRAALTDESGTGFALFQSGDLGTPTAGTLTNCTGLPIATGISGLAANIAAFLATPSSANLATAVTDELGTGSLLFSGAFAWTTRTFSAGNYTASGSMTWTVASGDVKTDDYVIVGKLLHMVVSLDTTTVGGTPGTTLFIPLPGGATAAKQQRWPAVVNDNGGGFTSGLCAIGATGTTISVFRDNLANWSASTDNTSVDISIAVEIQ